MQRSLNQNYQPGFVEDPFPGGISIGYDFNEVGNLAKLRTADQTDPPQRLFGYDTLNRLNEVKDGSTQALLQGYDYDATGNRESATFGGTTTNYTYPAASHRLSAVGGTGRSYDNAGNTTAIGGSVKEFVYNGANRLSQVKQGGVATMHYRYNGHGEQVRKYLGTSNTYTLYDEAGRWLGDYDSNGAVIQQAIWLDDLPVGVLVGSGSNQKLHYVQPDALGTPRVVIDPVRDVAVWTWALTGEAFGNSAPNQDPDGDGTAFVFDMRFPGQRYDAASGLNQNGFREYETATGRYPQSDPIGLLGGISTYGYVSGNALTSSDFYGLSAKCRREARYQGGWYFTGVTRDDVFDRRKVFEFCIAQFEGIGNLGGVDPSPDPGEYRRHRRIAPPKLPPMSIDVYWMCRNHYLERYRIERQKARPVSVALVCRDNCGNITSSTWVDSYQHYDWVPGETDFRIAPGPWERRYD